jgi:UDP-N-acetylmuramyl pentapeptide synthase
VQRIDESVQNRAIDILRQLREQGVDVSNLCVDSRTVRTGDVFLAYPGETQDGAVISPAPLPRPAAVLWSGRIRLERGLAGAKPAGRGTAPTGGSSCARCLRASVRKTLDHGRDRD